MTAATLSDLDRRRLRWRARRGLLENDLIIGRFLDRHELALDQAQAAALLALLELPDNELLDLLLARNEPGVGLDHEQVRDMLARLRAA
jgi:antitoxin CptB